MEINIKKILKLSKVLLIVLAFAFSSNMNANTNVSTTATSTTLNLSASATALTWNWGWWKKKKKKKKRRRHRCGKCQRTTCGGHGDKVPLSGGLGILVLGAAAFGVKKLRSKRNDIA